MHKRMSSHGDEDHIGGALYLIDNFKVDNVILNKGDYTELEVELITHLKNKNIKYTNNINKIPLLGSYMYLLNTKNINSYSWETPPLKQKNI